MIPLFFSKSEYAKRRSQILEQLRPSQDIFIFLSPPERVRSYDSHHIYRQDSNILYLTGFAEAESAVVLYRTQKASKTEEHFVLFCRPRDREMEQWNGYRHGPEGAKKLTAADEAYNISEFESYVLNLIRSTSLQNAPRIFSNTADELATKNHLDNIFGKFHPFPRKGERAIEAFLDAPTLVQRSRLCKSATELAAMQEAADINVEAHLRGYHAVKPGMYEYEVQAVIESCYRERGGCAPAYNSICASGPNATILHYNDSDRLMKAGDLLLMDAGCEHKFFASDITRTYPVNGKYTAAQRSIMDIVAEAQQAVFEVAKAGLAFAKLHETAEDCLIEGLISLKILKGKVSEIKKKATHKRYYPHGTSHWLGLDVHDPCPYKNEKNESTPLQNGVVFTVEPGLYFMSDDDTVDKKYRGIGVRIEDDVYIDSKGKAQILTKNLPRTATEIEKVMSKKR